MLKPSIKVAMGSQPRDRQRLLSPFQDSSLFFFTLRPSSHSLPIKAFFFSFGHPQAHTPISKEYKREPLSSFFCCCCLQLFLFPSFPVCVCSFFFPLLIPFKLRWGFLSFRPSSIRTQGEFSWNKANTFNLSRVY